MNKTYVTVLVLVLVVAGGLFFFTQSKKSEAPDMMGARGNWDIKKNEGAKMTSSIPADYNAPVTDTKAPLKEFTVTGQNFSFTPNTISVKKGDHVKITFQDAQGFHDFKIDEYKVATPRIQTAGGTATVEFIADQVGSFQYYCSVGSHRAMGMFGTLTVQ